MSTVPRPGRSRSGIQSSSTTTPVRIVTIPIADAGPLGHALVEHVPRAEPEVGPHHEADPHPEEDQPEEQPWEPSAQLAAGGKGEHPGTLRRPGAGPTRGFG